jgi:hypothetical protein
MRALILAMLLGACGPTITLTDDIDLTWDWGPTLTRFEDSLHGPYVRGTRTTLYVGSSDDKQDWTGWTIASTDPTIVRVDATAYGSDGLSAPAQAVAEGECDLVVLDDKAKVVGRGHAVVAFPDRVELDAHGYLIVGRDDEAPVTEARILEGGEATYLVKYFAGDTELHGNGVLTTGAVDGLDPEPRTSFLFENREWLSITSTASGTVQLPLIVDGTPLGTAQVVTVGEDAIDGMALIPQGEDNASNGDWLVALAQSYDANGQRIFGVDYTWDLDGTPLDAEGDLYRYEYQSGDWEMVTATHSAASDSAMIQSDKGYVDSTNNVGCNAAGASSPLIGLALLLVKRRKRR